MPRSSLGTATEGSNEPADWCFGFAPLSKELVVTVGYGCVRTVRVASSTLALAAKQATFFRCGAPVSWRSRIAVPSAVKPIRPFMHQRLRNNSRAAALWNLIA